MTLARIQSLQMPNISQMTIGSPKTSPEAAKWKAAADEEFKSLQKNRTWTLQDLPRGRSPISCKWVFKRKLDQEGKIARYKARLVARGFSQKYGQDYEETYAPVVKFPTMRIILTLAAHKDLEMLQMDVGTAYLNEIITESIYMSQPNGYEEPGQESKVCKLDKSIYGLKQSGRGWYEQLDLHLIKCRFVRATADSNLYIRTRKEGTVYLLVYVDDLLLASKNPKLLEVVKNLLSTEFERKVLGDPAFLLGVHIQRNRESGMLTIDQSKYAAEILRRFNMEESHGVSTPIAAGTKLDRPEKSASTEEQRELDRLPYKQAVGSLIFLACLTRPDLAYAVHVVSQHMSNYRT